MERRARGWYPAFTCRHCGITENGISHGVQAPSAWSPRERAQSPPLVIWPQPACRPPSCLLCPRGSHIWKICLGGGIAQGVQALEGALCCLPFSSPGDSSRHSVTGNASLGNGNEGGLMPIDLPISWASHLALISTGTSAVVSEIKGLNSDST